MYILIIKKNPRDPEKLITSVSSIPAVGLRRYQLNPVKPNLL